MEFAGFKFVPNALMPPDTMAAISPDEMRRIEAEAARRMTAAIDAAWKSWFGAPGHPAPPCKCRIVHVPGCPNFCP